MILRTTTNRNSAAALSSLCSAISRRRGGVEAALSSTTVSSSLAFSTSTRELLQNPDALLPPPPLTSSSNVLEVYNPANPTELVGTTPLMGREETQAAIQASSAALAAWRDETTAAHRAQLLQAWSQAMKEHAQDVATIMTLESGKPLKESLGEVGYATSFIDWFASQAQGSSGAGGGFIMPTPFVQAGAQAPRGQILAIQQAVGVTGLITPWNFPAAMITRKVAPALSVGCTAVVKPAELTPLTAVALHKLAIDAGIPPDVFSLVTADRALTPDVGHELCTNLLVDKVSFTGSVPVGKQLLEWCSGTVKRVSMELGGNAPFIVCEDADLELAVNAAVASKFRNAGQTCVCADRFLVHASLYDAFLQQFAEKVQQLKVGTGLDPTTDMGPMITPDAAQRVAEKVETAIHKEGATCLTGGPDASTTSLGPSFYPPTILTGRDDDDITSSIIWTTETFGPVAAVASFETDEQALALANDCEVGLASYVCTSSLDRAWRYGQKLQAGMVGVNEGIISNAAAPFGGVKESGMGREGSELGLAEYLETKYVFMNT